jgi:predicted CXXCH cytochrome family protein
MTILSVSAQVFERHRLLSTVASLAIMAGVTIAAIVLLRDPTPTPNVGSSSRTTQTAQPALRPDRLITFTDGCLSSECHANYTLAPVQHAAIAESACETCHASDTGGHVYPLLAPKEHLCASCHAKSEHTTFQHRAMTEDGCLACHDPHVSHTKGLLKAASMDEACAGCHPRTTASFAHKPYAADRCDSCHDTHGSDFPKLLFSGEGANHCRQCHSDLVDRVEVSPHSHCDIDGGCLACHAPHGSDHKHLLPSAPRDLCVTCHPNVGSAVSGAHVSHDAVLTGEQCVTCHDPHASQLPKMLRDSQTEICLSCHAKPLKAADGRTIAALADALHNSPVVHGAIRHGDCSACHAIHGGSHAKLLKEAGPNELLAPGEARTYALCFTCHDPTLMDPKGTTQFRNGSRNLHDLHLRGAQQSRGCGSCHAAHAGSLPRLIATTVNFQGSGWAMPMKFVLSPEGGSCAPGCHEKLSYSRNADPSTSDTSAHQPTEVTR